MGIGGKGHGVVLVPGSRRGGPGGVRVMRRRCHGITEVGVVHHVSKDCIQAGVCWCRSPRCTLLAAVSL